MIINSFRKQSNHFSQTREVLEVTLNSWRKDKILQDDKKLPEELNTFFKNVVSTLDIDENFSIINQNFQNFDDPVDRAIECINIIRVSSLLMRK